MDAPPESDEILVQRLLPSRNSDPEDRVTAWQEWYTCVGETSIMGFIKAKNDTIELDIDIFQEAMLTAFVEIERGHYEPRTGIPLTAYVKGIARNKIREARRRTWRFVPLDDAPEGCLESDDLHLDLTVERQEQGEALFAGLAKLNQSRRQVLEGYLEGSSTTEIAEALGMTEALVRQHKSRGLRTLREIEPVLLCR
ncbi:MAG: sigma-70 family RNA polymerase sigma factor [Nitrososphaera sp.]|nr:sigma-70 family RNA polymerase sigma factor [Nitrososphaera sp.]